MIKITAEIPDIKKIFPIEKIDGLVKELALQIRARMIQATPRDSGTAQRSWGPVKRHSGGMSFSGGNPTGPVARQSVGYSFGNTAPYSHILETGSTPGKKPWASVGPRTVERDGRIYSSQAPGGIYQTAGIEQFVKQALPKLIEKYLK